MSKGKRVTVAAFVFLTSLLMIVPSFAQQATSKGRRHRAASSRSTVPTSAVSATGFALQAGLEGMRRPSLSRKAASSTLSAPTAPLGSQSSTSKTSPKGTTTTLSAPLAPNGIH